MKMNMRPTSTMQTPNAGSCYIDFKSPVAAAYYLPPPAVTNPLDDFSEPSDSFASACLQANLMASDVGMFLNESHFPTNLPSPLFATCGMHQRDTQSDVFMNCHNGEDGSWSGGQLQDLLDFPESMPVSNGESRNITEILSSENIVERSNNWRDLTQSNVYVDSVEPHWIEFGAVSDEVNQQRKVPQSSEDIVVPRATLHQQRWLPSIEFFASNNSASASQSSKPRMRWTQELHEAFVDAVIKLGGSARATPKAILSLMNLDSLTIKNVKSHLQKYRDLKASMESSEGNSEVRTSAMEQAPPVDLETCMTITEALRMQMKVQKQLHEQLEIQRKLQIRIEEQGKYLLQMLELQNKAEDKFKSTPFKRDRPGQPDYMSEASDLDRERGVVTSSSSEALREIPHASKGKQKVMESSPPVKRRRIGDARFSSTGSYI